MRFGVQVSAFSWDGGPAQIGPTFGRIARTVEDAGLDSLWVMDHFFQISMIGPPEMEMLEGYTALAYAAALTERIELGTLVTGVTYRHPGVLLKTVTTLDVLSGGRAWLGIGAAWNQEEHDGLGVPFPPLGERFQRLEEVLQLARRMFAADDSPFEGRHYTLTRPLNSPAPLRRPPIMVGGMGEQKTLRLVAQYADACNLFDIGAAGVAAKLDVLRRHCERVGRDPAQIATTVLSSLAISRSGRKRASGESTTSVGQAVDRYARLAEVGVDQVILGLGADTDNDEVYPLLADLRRQLT